MGLDGGTLPTRSDILRRSSWKLIQRDKSKSTRGGVVDASCEVREQTTAQKHELARVLWSACALSGEQLKPPIVGCRLGYVYNRSSVIEFLCGTQRFERTRTSSNNSGAFSHIKSIRDVFELKLEANPAATAAEHADAPAPFICPISGLESNGIYQFVALPSCGHVFAEKSLTGLCSLSNQKATSTTTTATTTTSSTTSTAETVCPLCGVQYVMSNCVMLNPINEQYAEINKKRMKEYEAVAEEERKRKREGKAKSSKKKSKRTKTEAAAKELAAPPKPTNTEEQGGTTTATTTATTTTPSEQQPTSQPEKP